MATSVTVYDLDNYPDNSKTISVDQKTLVPIGYEGDEQWVLSFTTTAYSNITSRTAIQDMYVREIIAGWAKSSGFTGSNGKFTLVSGINNQLNIKLDNSTGAVGNNGYYTITLNPGVNITGVSVAHDMEDKIRTIVSGTGWNTADTGYALSYLNAIVTWDGSKFWIVSGNIGKYYTGATRTSVKVAQYSTDVCYQTLGFDLGVTSEQIASISPKEVLLASNYTGGATSMIVGAGLGAVAKNCCAITDGVTTEYFQALTVSGTTLTMASTAISGSYTSGTAKVQVLSLQDPDLVPAAYFSTVDSIIRFGISCLINQIDFSA